jgi:GNAT superfamily N-acetyltransferase
MSTVTPTSVRAYRDGDEPALVALFESAFGRRISVDHWRWKFKHAGSSMPNVWLAVADERPVFQCGGIPISFQLGPRRVTMMHVCDVMTAPDFRRRGLHTQVSRHAYDFWRERGVAFVSGMPNENWGKTARALGWRPLFRLQWLMRPLRPEAFILRRLGLPFPRRASLLGPIWSALWRRRARRDPSVTTEAVAAAGSEFDAIWERCRDDFRFSIVRDAAWLQWRFLSSPTQRYRVVLARQRGEPVGYSALRLVTHADRTTAQLAEIVAPESSRGVRATLLAEVLETAAANHAESIVTLAVPGTARFRFLRRAGFLTGPAFDVEFVPLASDLPETEMREPLHWQLSGADFDVI